VGSLAFPGKSFSIGGEKEKSRQRQVMFDKYLQSVLKLAKGLRDDPGLLRDLTEWIAADSTDEGSMLCVVLARLGGDGRGGGRPPLSLLAESRAMPAEPPEGWLVVQVFAAGVDPTDLALARGHLPFVASRGRGASIASESENASRGGGGGGGGGGDCPLVPGSGWCGLVVKGSIDSLGQVMCGCGPEEAGAWGARDGTLRQFMTVRESACCPKPEGLSVAAAAVAGVPLTTAFVALHGHALDPKRALAHPAGAGGASFFGGGGADADFDASSHSAVSSASAVSSSFATGGRSFASRMEEKAMEKAAGQGGSASSGILSGRLGSFIGSSFGGAGGETPTGYDPLRAGMTVVVLGAETAAGRAAVDLARLAGCSTVAVVVTPAFVALLAKDAAAKGTAAAAAAAATAGAAAAAAGRALEWEEEDDDGDDFSVSSGSPTESATRRGFGSLGADQLPLAGSAASRFLGVASTSTSPTASSASSASPASIQGYTAGGSVPQGVDKGGGFLPLNKGLSFRGVDPVAASPGKPSGLSQSLGSSLGSSLGASLGASLASARSPKRSTAASDGGCSRKPRRSKRPRHEVLILGPPPAQPLGPPGGARSRGNSIADDFADLGLGGEPPLRPPTPIKPPPSVCTGADSAAAAAAWDGSGWAGSVVEAVLRASGGCGADLVVDGAGLGPLLSAALGPTARAGCRVRLLEPALSSAHHLRAALAAPSSSASPGGGGPGGTGGFGGALCGGAESLGALGLDLLRDVLLKRLDLAAVSSNDVDANHAASILRAVAPHFGPPGGRPGRHAPAPSHMGSPMAAPLSPPPMAPSGLAAALLGSSLGSSPPARGSNLGLPPHPSMLAQPPSWPSGTPSSGALSAPRVDPLRQAFALDAAHDAFRLVATARPSDATSAQSAGPEGPDLLDCAVICPSGPELLQ